MKPDPSNSLAVIIPAYKGRFLSEALEGFALQTDQRFNLYIGDDASPDDIKSICDRFTGRLKFSYHRFDKNMGRVTLAGHWTRCVRLSSAPWVWLFSDDDVPAHNCVEKFYHYLRSGDTAAQLLHFDVDVIDGSGKVLRTPEPYGEFLTSAQYTMQRLSYSISSYAVEYIFRRDTFEREGGFAQFPMAWCADDATWALFGAESGIRTLKGAKVAWRQSGMNISSRDSPYKREKIEAAIAYLRWLSSSYADRTAFPAHEHQGQSAMRKWFFAQLYRLNPRLGLARCFNASRELATLFGTSRTYEAYRLLRNELRAILSYTSGAQS